MHRVRPLRLVPVRVPRLGVQRLDRQREPPHDLEQAEGWEAAVLNRSEAGGEAEDGQDCYG